MVDRCGLRTSESKIGFDRVVSNKVCFSPEFPFNKTVVGFIIVKEEKHFIRRSQLTVQFYKLDLYNVQG